MHSGLIVRIYIPALLLVIESPNPTRLRGILSRPSTPSTPKASQKLRFSADPAEIHVYESQPASPRRPLALLPPPDPQNPSENSIDISGSVKLVPHGSHTPDDPRSTVDDDIEGSPEYIRRRYFPSAPPNDPALEWMKPSTASTNLNHGTSQSGDPPTRYDLQGLPISSGLQTSLQTHLGLHHHGGDEAGYTLDDLLLLSRSTAVSQRAIMLGVLAKIVSGVALSVTAEKRTPHGEELRLQVFTAGVEALAERGSVGIRAVEAIWSSVVEWDSTILEQTGAMNGDVSLQGDETSALLASTDLPNLLILITNHLLPRSQTLPSTSLTQLLQILHRISLDSPDLAEKVQNTQHLLPSVLQTFVTMPTESVNLDPLAVRLITVIARSSRKAAKSTIDSGMADSLLRFVVILPDATSTPNHVSYQMLTETLELYRALAQYGMYCSTSAGAAVTLNALASHMILPMDSAMHSMRARVVQSWLGVLTAWITCAIDPHQTTPSHDILWSQVIGWDWISDVLQLRNLIVQVTNSPELIRVGIWRALACWVEGVRVNGVRAGVAERGEIADLLKAQISWEAASFVTSLEELNTLLHQASGVSLPEIGVICQIGTAANVLDALFRLANAFGKDLPPSEATPFNITHPTSSAIYGTCITVVSHPIWDVALSPAMPASSYPVLRPLSSFLHSSLLFLRSRTDVSDKQWLNLALRTIPRLLPGDSSLGQQIFLHIRQLISNDFVSNELEWNVAQEVWDKGGLEVLGPFFDHSMAPLPTVPELESDEPPDSIVEDPVVIAPFIATPASLAKISTQTLPSVAELRKGSVKGLPLRGDWVFSPVNDLLRSSTSPVFRTLPREWDHSELDIVRATTLFVRIALQITGKTGEDDASSLLSREEAVFGCMKVFMLEHGQVNDSATLEDSSNEVFRDDVVSANMRFILSHFAVRSAHQHPTQPTLTLEQVAVPFLGVSTPFFQFYTDFIALYDSISFSHSMFASLLLPPLSMRYPPDYRKLLWGDYCHALRTITVEPDDVLGISWQEWMSPMEEDGEMIGLYLKALGGGRAKGFLRWIAVHHIACNLWEDLWWNRSEQNSSLLPNTSLQSRKAKLLSAVIRNSDLDAVRSIVLYHQNQCHNLIQPPNCIAPAEIKRLRLQAISSWGVPQAKQRLENLLI